MQENQESATGTATATGVATDTAPIVGEATATGTTTGQETIMEGSSGEQQQQQKAARAAPPLHGPTISSCRCAATVLMAIAAITTVVMALVPPVARWSSMHRQQRQFPYTTPTLSTVEIQASLICYAPLGSTCVYTRCPVGRTGLGVR